MHLTPNSLIEKSFNKHSSTDCSLLEEHGLLGLKVFKDIPGNGAYKKNLVINLFLSQQLNHIKKELYNVQVKQVIPLKGMSLLGSVYKDMGERRITDIDLLVQEEDVEKIRSYLTSAGYKEIKEKKWSATQHKYIFKKNSFIADIELEFHTGLFYHFKLDKLTSELTTTSISKELEFVYLCYHLAEQHNFIKLKWLYDIFLYMKEYEESLDLSKVILLSKEINILPSVYASLYCLDAHMGLKTNCSISLPNKIKNILSWSFLLKPKRRSLDYMYLKKYLKGQRSASYFKDKLIFDFFK